MSGPIENMSFTINSEFWENVKRVADAISDETKRTDSQVDNGISFIGEAPIETPCSPIISPLSPVMSANASSPSHTPAISPITPPQRQSNTMSANTSQHHHFEVEVSGLQHAPENSKGDTTGSTSTMDPRNMERVQSREALKSSNLNPNVPPTTERPRTRSALSTRPTESASPSVSKSAPTLPTAPATATRAKKNSSPVRTIGSKFPTAADVQPTYSSTTGELIDPVTSRPYFPKEIIDPPVQKCNTQADQGYTTRMYLNSKITPALLAGLKVAAQQKPEKPLAWLSEYLMQKSAELETE